MIDFEALGARLQDANLGKLGENITYNTMPQSVKKGICLRANISGDDIDYEIPGLGRGEFRLFTRATTVKQSETLLLQAIDALAVNGLPVNIGKMRVRYCVPLTTPMSFPISDGNLRESSVTMLIVYDFPPEEYKWLSPRP